MGAILITLIFILFSFCSTIAAAANNNGGDDGDGLLQTYIIYVKKPNYDLFSETKDLDTWYQSFLPETIPDDRQSRMVRCYKNVISGFAARLTAEEVKAMETKSGFIAAHVEKKLRPHTTNTPAFLGLNRNSGFWKDSNFGKGIIIGVLDTGVTPGHPSFSDHEGMSPPPAKWKGICEQGVTCNNKIIGFRNFYTRKAQPIDISGHGTHTSSTAAGNFVDGANVFGLANGTAAGMAPLAHLAIYKLHDYVSSIKLLPSKIVTDAIEAAVQDGVDVLSLSFGVGNSTTYFDNAIAIAAFRAIKKGVFVSIAAANFGPGPSTLINDAPWMLTVGASSTDRTLAASAQLGNNQVSSYDGETTFQPKDFPFEQLPLVYAIVSNESETFYSPETMKSVDDVRGKIVLCQRINVGTIQAGTYVKKAGGAAMIVMNDQLMGYTIFQEHHELPAMTVSYAVGESIKAYINSTSSPTAAITFKGTVIGKKSAPEVAFFSSRGPSVRSPGILKPDIIAPGLNILGAGPATTGENKTNTNTNTNFNFFLGTGTSSSCPHLSGIAALLKSTHPDWSPAAIKSAIMTTADIVNLEGKPILDQNHLPADLFAVGAGHVNPSKANDPGLIYDIQPDDYIPYLCSLKYTDLQIQSIVSRAVHCLNLRRVFGAELNYPSFSIKLGSSPQTHHRTVTNVGESNSSYTPRIIAPEGVGISVQPDRLSFTEKNQRATYSVTFTRTCETCGPYAQAYLSWVSGRHSVRSPIAITFE